MTQIACTFTSRPPNPMILITTTTNHDSNSGHMPEVVCWLAILPPAMHVWAGGQLDFLSIQTRRSLKKLQVGAPWNRCAHFKDPLCNLSAPGRRGGGAEFLMIAEVLKGAKWLRNCNRSPGSTLPSPGTPARSANIPTSSDAQRQRWLHQLPLDSEATIT